MVSNDKKLVKHLQRQYSNEKVIEKHMNQNKILNDDEVSTYIYIYL